MSFIIVYIIGAILTLIFLYKVLTPDVKEFFVILFYSICWTIAWPYFITTFLTDKILKRIRGN